MEKPEDFRILPAGESCIFVDFGSMVNLEINGRVQALKKKIETEQLPGIREVVPTYRSLAIYFDPILLDLEKFIKRLEEIIPDTASLRNETARTVVIPVCYGGEFGPDLERVASLKGLTCEEVIRRHSSRDYYCYMLGFTPGFPYLGGMDESISAPRLESPREIIPAGSVGIAGTQTGIYPISSPGGWQLIGRTPLILFDPHREPPILLESGIWIRFRPVSEEEYRQILEKTNSGNQDKETKERGRS